MRFPFAPFLALFLGCAGFASGQSTDGPAEPAKEDASYSKTLVDAQNRVACSLYHVLSRERPEANLVFAPSSLFPTFGMLYAGARGNTASEMKTVLCLDDDPARLLDDLKNLAQHRRNGVGKGNVLRSPNGFWIHEPIALEPLFQKQLSERLGANVERVDFSSNPDSARDGINGWVSERTSGKIARLLDRLDPKTSLVAVNVMVFEGRWAHPFPPEKTGKAKFTAADDRQSDIDLMTRICRIPYARGKGYRAISLPYSESSLQMVMVLPDAPNGLPTLEKHLSRETISGWTKDLADANVVLKIPKVRLRSKLELKAPLERLGLKQVFSATADFSGIEKTGSVRWVQRIVHEATLGIDEAGVQAAAATGAVVSRSKVAFTADHPFLYLIRDSRSGEILFIGRFVQPDSDGDVPR